MSKQTDLCSVYCNVIRMKCAWCMRYFVFCLGHRRPGKHNRCICDGMDTEEGEG